MSKLIYNLIVSPSTHIEDNESIVLYNRSNTIVVNIFIDREKNEQLDEKIYNKAVQVIERELGARRYSIQPKRKENLPFVKQFYRLKSYEQFKVTEEDLAYFIMKHDDGIR